MRGTLGAEFDKQMSTGITPAHAGNTLHVVPYFVYGGDHPRPCGEHSTQKMSPVKQEGSPPPMRGTPF